MRTQQGGCPCSSGIRRKNSAISVPMNGRRVSIWRLRTGWPSCTVSAEGIFNHLTLVVPGHSDRYYQIPFGMHWSEVTASSFMEVGIEDGKIRRGAGEVERSCFCIHAPIHKRSEERRVGKELRAGGQQ